LPAVNRNERTPCLTVDRLGKYRRQTSAEAPIRLVPCDWAIPTLKIIADTTHYRGGILYIHMFLINQNNKTSKYGVINHGKEKRGVG
jgi:hypothetical protein